MQRQRGDLVPVAEVLSDLSGQVQAIRDTSPQALHHFTQADQVTSLSGPAKRTRLSASCADDGAVLPAPAPTPATASSTSASTARTSSS